MEKLLLVDGHNLLFQMFYGMPSRIVGRSGQPVQGVLGFVGALLRMVRMVSPSHVLVLFDGEHPSPRRELDPAYKVSRPDYTDLPPEEQPFSQLPDIRRALDALHVRWIETEDCEADDLAAAYARQLEPDMQVVIASWDSDLFQLIDDQVSVLRYRGKDTRLFTAADIRRQFGVAPGQYAAFKALVGDPSDNIPGVTGVGPKTAARLLHQYGPLEEILRRLEEVDKNAIRQALRREQEQLRRSYALIRLEGGHALPLSPDALAFTVSPVTTTQLLRRMGIL